jgi:excinuclease ABC subunit C
MYDISKLDIFPVLPGVYLMKNQNGNVLYVGKAKNLRQRVKQYFFPGRDSRPIIPLLVAKVTDIETIIVSSEKEALLLENTLIKKYKPKYNALLKDDKTYIALKINNKHTWPTVRLVRYKGRPEPDGLYFGPYTSALAARNTFDMLHRIFPLRECSDQEFARRTRPCILYDMKRCIAPCVGKCTKEEYDYYVDRTIKFLKGQDKEILKELYERMHREAEALEFEKAATLLQTIREIEITIEEQKVNKPLGGDADVISIFRQGSDVIISQLLVREGKLLGSNHFNFAHIAEDDDELLSSFLLQHYSQKESLPHEILVPTPIPNADDIAEILSSGQRRQVYIYNPQRGEKRALVEMAFTNAEATFKKEKDVKAIREKTLLEMQEQLRLNRYPERIECFDNSHLSGDEPVSVMVAFFNGEKDKKRYRKYKLNTAYGQDDYSSMYEVLMRRYKRGKDEDDLPDLLIVDGGKGHLNVALKVMEELNIITVDVIAVAKEQGRHDKGITTEQVFLPNVKDPIILKRHSPILFLLQQIRDEAHRFVITFQRNRRGKKIISSAVKNIPGIGPIKSKVLLRHFGSLKNLLLASREDLEKVPGLSKTNIEAILIFISKENSNFKI